MLCIPSHMTHDAQPLDCTVFSPFKSKWREVCHVSLQKNPGKVITKLYFNALFSEAWLESVTGVNAIAGFKSCPLIPMFSKCFKCQETALHQSQFTVLKQLQLMSPVQGLWIVTTFLVLIRNKYFRNILKRAIICSLIPTMLDGSLFTIRSSMIKQSFSHWLTSFQMSIRRNLLQLLSKLLLQLFLQLMPAARQHC